MHARAFFLKGVSRRASERSIFDAAKFLRHCAGRPRRYGFGPDCVRLEDGGEEWRCALAIDEHPLVKRWVRNLDSDPVA
ncbi:MAG: hypothetical protein MUF44_00760, partial [Hydrogenophaga sp.]|nr:hypothetical protein [Hydrogenophaga sp.]